MVTLNDIYDATRTWLLRQPHSPEIEEALAVLDGFPAEDTRQDPDGEVTR